jgi:glycosyltransferase involved in cell wall biosynthesis
MLGFQSDEVVGRLYSQALALVHPSKMEGFGLTGLEAMKVGLPVVSSSASCLPEVYQDAALFFDPENVDDLVAKLEMIIGDQHLRDQLKDKGLLLAKKYSWRKMAKETLSVYNQILPK